MKRLMLVLVFGLSAACGGDDVSKPEFSPKEKAEFEQPSTTEDLCDELNFYGDGECDLWCPSPDPDCRGGQPEPEPQPQPEPRPEPEPQPEPEPEPEPQPGFCPDPDAPNVSYISTDPDECAVIDFACAEGWEYIPDPECGCGCFLPTCEDAADCNEGQRCAVDGICRGEECAAVCVPATCGLPGTAICLAIPSCDDGEIAAEVNGCFTCVDADTCVDEFSMCASDADCVDGFCDASTAQCTYPNCDDGQPTACDALRPDCGDYFIGAARDGCWACVDPRTCLSPNVPG